MKDNIEQINIKRYSRKSRILSLGFSIDKISNIKDMLSNFIEHCYKNIEDLSLYEDKIDKLNYLLNK